MQPRIYALLLTSCAIGPWARAGESDSAPGGAPLNWTRFRGPACGVSPWTNAPAAWDGATGAGVLWKTPLALTGVSSPVLWGSVLFITEGNEKDRAVLAFDARDGRQLWRRVVPDGGEGTPLPPVSDYGLAIPTPTCDADGVYALFGTGDLAAFSHDGTPKWRMFLGRPKIGYGFASSPCAVNGLVCVQFDHHARGRLLAVEAATGHTAWDQERSRVASWSSLLVVSDADGKPLVVANANGSTTAYDLTGRMVWDVDGATGEVAPSPAWWEGRIYAVNIGSRLYCHQVRGAVEKLWEYRGHLSDTASPIVVDGLFFMTTGSGVVSCLDAKTGEKLWTQRLAGAYASLVSSGNRIYMLGRDGTMRIFAAERAFRLLGACTLGEDVDATPAMTNGRFYIRGSRHLWCLGANAAREP